MPVTLPSVCVFFQVVELKPGGKDIPVTTANRIAYIHLVADYRLNKQIRAHCLAFRQGLANVVNLEWLRMFDQQEIQVAAHTHTLHWKCKKWHICLDTNQSVTCQKRLLIIRLADIIDRYYLTACLLLTPYFKHFYLWLLIKCKQLASIYIFRYWFLVHTCPSVWKTWRNLLTTQVLQEHPSQFLLVTSFFYLRFSLI